MLTDVYEVKGTKHRTYRVAVRNIMGTSASRCDCGALDMRFLGECARREQPEFHTPVAAQASGTRAYWLPLSTAMYG